MKKLAFMLALVCLLSTLLLSGCQVESDRSEKPGPDWSRGLYLGRTHLRQPVALQVDADRHVHLVWIDESQPSRLRYVHLDPQAKVLLNERLDITLPNLRRPQLLVDREGRLHLAWMSRQGGIQGLYHTVVSPQGEVDTIKPISVEGRNVDSYHTYLSPDGQVTFVWGGELADGGTGLTYASLQDSSTPVSLVQGGIDPHVVVDDAGAAHLIWLTERSLTSRTLHYAELTGASPDLGLAPAGGQVLAELSFPEGGVYHRPVMGLDERRAYVLWSIQHLGGGLTPTAAFTFYVTFEVGAPEQAVGTTRAVGVPAVARPVYEELSATGSANPYGFTQLSPVPEGAAGGSDFVNTPATVAGQSGQLPVAVSVLTSSRAESRIVLATLVFADGAPIGYQLASKTETASLVPSMAADPENGLHLAWLDTAGFKQYTVYYATTAPEARRWLDRTSPDDLLLQAGDLVFGVFSGLGLLPIAGIWVFPAMVWVVLFFIVTGREELARTPTKIGFAVAVVLYVGMKILMLPGLFIGTPFLHRVPPAWALTLGILVPSIILLIALGAVYVYCRRAERATIFKAYFIFALTDAILTLVLYAPGFFGSG